MRFVGDAQRGTGMQARSTGPFRNVVIQSEAPNSNIEFNCVGASPTRMGFRTTSVSMHHLCGFSRGPSTHSCSLERLPFCSAHRRGAHCCGQRRALSDPESQRAACSSRSTRLPGPESGRTTYAAAAKTAIAFASDVGFDSVPTKTGKYCVPLRASSGERFVGLSIRHWE